jgi:hypothetical protein
MWCRWRRPGLSEIGRDRGHPTSAATAPRFPVDNIAGASGRRILTTRDYGDDGRDLKGAITLITEAYGMSVGAALAALKEAGLSGKVRVCANGLLSRHGFNRRGEIAPTAWRQHKINLETGNLDAPFGLRGLTDVVINATDLRYYFDRTTGARKSQRQKPAAPDTRRRGRTEMPYWVLMDKPMDDWLDINGVPVPGDGQQSELVRHIADLLAKKFDEHPSDTQLKHHVREHIQKYKTKQEATEGR